MLKVENLSTGYGKKQVLFNVSFDVNKGDIVLLAGSNGSGKSTLLKAIYGLLPQWDKGKIWFDGENITGKPTADLLRKGLHYIPQKNNLFEALTVKENLEMAGLTLEKKLLRQGIVDALSVFGSSRILVEKKFHFTAPFRFAYPVSHSKRGFLSGNFRSHETLEQSPLATEFYCSNLPTQHCLLCV